MRPIFMLVGEKSNLPFIFAVPPLDFRVTTANKIEVVNIIDMGEKTLAGNRLAERISFSTFLPNIKSHFFSALNPLPPTTGVEILKKWKDKKQRLTLIVPQYNVFFKCYIENFDYSIQERTGDIDVEIKLIEVKQNKTLIDTVVGLYKR